MTSNAVPFFDTMPRGHDSLTIGSAIFAKSGQRYWLISGAHVPLETQPHTKWSDWPFSMGVAHDPKASFTHVPLFARVAGVLVPLFRFSVNGSAMDDFMALPVEDDLALKLSKNIKCFDITAGKNPKVGDQVCGYGYPDVKEIWPYHPESRYDGEIKVRLPGMFRHTGFTQKGFSGGPVLSTDGELCGMSIGRDGDLGTAVDVSWIRQQLI